MKRKDRLSGELILLKRSSSENDSDSMTYWVISSVTSEQISTLERQILIEGTIFYRSMDEEHGTGSH